MRAHFKSLSKLTLCLLGGGMIALALDACAPKTSKSGTSPAALPEKPGLSVQEQLPQGKLGGNVRPTRYNLDFVIDPEADTFAGHAMISLSIKKPTKTIWLHGQTLDVSQAKLVLPEGQEVAAHYREVPLTEAPSGVAALSFETPVGPGDVKLVMAWTTPYNTKLNSAYKVGRNGENYIITQFEAIGARQAFPGFDEPRFKVPFHVTITAPKDDFVYANTPEIKTEAVDGDMIRHVFATTRPLPTYLLAFGVGPWDVIKAADIPANSVRRHPLPLRGIAVKGEGKNLAYALKHAGELLAIEENYFGIAYPYRKLDLIAAPDYNFGAMENPGAIVFTEFLLLMNDKASLGQRRASASVTAHEEAHQWFGDLVTPKWWDDIWLNEAFATWMGNKTIDRWKPKGNFDRQTLKGALRTMSADSLASTRKIAEPLKRTENVMDQFDGITYQKGAAVLAMFENWLGEENFRKGVQLHMKRYADSVASASDFFKSLADGSGHPEVVPALQSFIDQPGLPLVQAQMQCKTGGVRVSLTQSRFAPLGSTIKQGEVWQLPVCVRYGIHDKTYKVCTLLTETNSSLELGKSPCPDWIDPNADGAGYYRFALDQNGWAHVLVHLDELNAREQLSTLDSLAAGFQAGEMSVKTWLDGVAGFARLPAYDVASKAGDSLGGLRSRILPKSARPNLAKFVHELYADRYARIKDDDSREARLLAPTLAARLVEIGDDAALRDEFAEQGAKYLDLIMGESVPDVRPEMRGLALSEAFGKYKGKALPPLLKLVKSGTPAEKGAAVGALVNTSGDKALTAKLLAASLHDKETFTGRQAMRLVYGLVGNPDTQEQAWNWLKENFDAFVKANVADARLGGVPSVARGFCSKAKAREVEAFFIGKAALIPGSGRSLKQTLEAINLCAAFKQAKAQEIEDALAARYAR